MSTLPITHFPERQTFELTVENHIARIEYRSTENGILITHTYVPPELRGRGVAAALASFALETARKQGWNVQSSCSYVQAYLAKHSEYEDIRA